MSKWIKPCSARCGSKTLFCSEGVALSKSPKSPGLVKAEGKSPYCTTPVSHMRFLRPVSTSTPPCSTAESPGRNSAMRVKEKPTNPWITLSQDMNVRRVTVAKRTPGRTSTTFHRSTKGSSFQFLEQRCGFFHCKKCNIRWESAYVGASLEPVRCTTSSSAGSVRLGLTLQGGAQPLQGLLSDYLQLFKYLV
ncbi:hypothetical protein KUCAC02_018544 [Chaenocephalus aceratus]|uniref:Uncharacterized protein n=1 Tax=Chaenocephalus aceratus TaxID=36190 RepID=A0ACB9W9R1_CHAAC|nr:hypothetical protein KUCAC02_018544 [Chaenocephalus aceratus]